MLKKCLSIIMVCFVFCATMIPTYAEENAGTDCGTCNLEDSDGTIQKTLDDVLNYTDEEKNMVMNSVENSTLYAEHADFIESSDRINVYKNDTTDSYFTVSYIQKKDDQVTGTLIFEINRAYEVEEVFGTESNRGKGETVITDYANKTTKVYSVQPRVDCYTMRCAQYEYRGTSGGTVQCEFLVGLACSVALSFTGPVISFMVCYAGTIATCSPAPAGKYCVQMTRVNACPY